MVNVETLGDKLDNAEREALSDKLADRRGIGNTFQNSC